VRDFRLEELPYLKEAEIQQVLEPYKGKNLTLSQIEEATAQVGELYRQKGYPVVQVYLPRQRAEDQVVVIRAVVGAFGTNSVENSSLVADWFVDSLVSSNFPTGQPVKRPDLERLVLLIGDLPGAGLPKIDMGAGQTPGTTDFVVQVPREARLSGFFSSDDMGSYYTGRWRFMAGVDVNSPFNLGDKLSVFGLTTETRGVNSLALNYELPLNSKGLRLNLGFSEVYYRLGKDYEDLEATGRSETFEATLSYPIVRSADRNFNLTFSLYHKRMEDRYGAFDLSLKSQSYSGKFGLSYERWTSLFGKALYTRTRGGLTYGNFSLPTEEQREQEGTDGAFAYANLEFLANLAFTDNFSFSLTANGQKAIDRKLDSSEQFGVSGANGVKAYRESVSSDNGYTIGGELRYRLPSIGSVDHYVGAFADRGYWRREEKVAGLKNSDTLADVGLSYYLNFPHFSLKTQLVRAVGSYPEEIRKDSETYVIFNVVAFF
jgi:hemolysin activation/secretion protein